MTVTPGQQRQLRVADHPLLLHAPRIVLGCPEIGELEAVRSADVAVDAGDPREPEPHQVLVEVLHVLAHVRVRMERTAVREHGAIIDHRGAPGSWGRRSA
jgi:hypothetical protein